LQLPDANKVESAVAGGALIHDVAAQRTRCVDRHGDGILASRPVKDRRARSAVAVDGVASGPGDEGAVDRTANKVLDVREGIDPIEEGAKRFPDLPGLQVDGDRSFQGFVEGIVAAASIERIRAVDADKSVIARPAGKTLDVGELVGFGRRVGKFLDDLIPRYTDDDGQRVLGIVEGVRRGDRAGEREVRLEAADELGATRSTDEVLDVRKVIKFKTKLGVILQDKVV